MQGFNLDVPIVGILRGFWPSDAREIVAASIRGGLKNLEITMNTPGAADQIRAARCLAQGSMSIGAGTVMTIADLDLAQGAGAEFIVAPTAQPALIRECVRRGIPVFPGAFSPTEVAQAWDLGATMVKLFPAEIMGPKYIRAIKAPFPHIKLMPTGGVDLQTLDQYRRAGADAFGVGSPLFERARVEARDWQWIEARCREFTDAFLAGGQAQA